MRQLMLMVDVHKYGLKAVCCMIDYYGHIETLDTSICVLFFCFLFFYVQFVTDPLRDPFLTADQVP